MDLPLDVTDSWDTIGLRLPSGWQTDFLVLYLPYTTLPAWVWSTPLPLIGLAPDWNLLWHHYRHLLPKLDLVRANTPGVEFMAKAGLTHAPPANLFGTDRSLVDYAWPEGVVCAEILALA